MSQARLDFAQRAHLQEWMDEPCPYEEFRDCLLDLAKVNRLTFAYRPTLHWLRRFPAEMPLHIVDVGCGGGDLLRKLERIATREKRNWRLTGVDLNPHAARAAVEFTERNSRIEWRTGNIYSVRLPASADVVISSLFTHHLEDDDIVRFLAWMERVTVRGWFINDLHREAVPFYLFRALASVMRWHRFVRHDGPISIRRAFRREDWKRYLESAGIPWSAVDVQTFRPARLCVARNKA